MQLLLVELFEGFELSASLYGWVSAQLPVAKVEFDHDLGHLGAATL